MGLDERHVVRTSVAVPDGSGLYRLGSGYVIATGLVLTAAHVLEPAEGTAAEKGQFAEIARMGADWEPATVAWVDPDRDIAVLSCPTLTAPAVVRWGRLVGSDPIEWGAAGFPVASVDPKFGRQVEHAFGRTSPITGREAGRLALSVESREAKGRDSPWAGLSGAAVFCAEFLVGVVTADSGNYAKSLVGQRAEDFCQASQLTELLGQALVLEGVSRSARGLPTFAATRMPWSRGWPIARRAGLPKQLSAIADLVAIAVQREWSYEAIYRQLDDPYAMSVKWSPADAELTTSWANIERLASTGSGWPVAAGPWARSPAELAGGDNDLVSVLNLVPTRRLVVTGAPGSGKTVLLVRLILDLLERRRPGEAVPVLLPLASWNPAKDDLNDWVERWLVTNIPALAQQLPDSPGLTRARAMLEAGLFLLILDGLDEMQTALRHQGIAKINEALLPGQAVVLATRTEAFSDAVRGSAKLAGAAGITLLQVDPDTIFDYLRDSAGSTFTADGWEAVRRAVKTDGQLPAAQALSTPLMAALARTVYNYSPGSSDASVDQPPTELLDQTHFPTANSITQHLFRAFVPAAYRVHPHPARRGKFSATKARRCLTFLAANMTRVGSGATDFEWWRLPGATPSMFASLTIGLFVAAIGTLGIPYPGLGIGLIASAVVVLLGRRLIAQGKQGLGAGLIGGIIGAQLSVLPAIAIFGTGHHYGELVKFLDGAVGFAFAVTPFKNFLIGLAASFSGFLVTALYEQSALFASTRNTIGWFSHLIDGVGLGIIIGLVVALNGRRVPARAPRWSFLGSSGGAGCGLILTTVVWLQDGPRPGITFGLILTIGGLLAGGLYGTADPTDLTKAADPMEVLRRDRRTFLTMLSLGIPFGTGVLLATAPARGSFSSILGGLGVGITDLVAAGLALAFLQSTWGYFMLARVWLWIAGDIPWHIMDFLMDAHEKRGVLRRVGSVYQFRHFDLQRYLADRKVEPEEVRASLLLGLTVAIDSAGRTSCASRKCKTRIQLTLRLTFIHGL